MACFEVKKRHLLLVQFLLYNPHISQHFKQLHLFRGGFMVLKRSIFSTLIIASFAIYANAEFFTGSVLGEWQNVIYGAGDVYHVSNNDASGQATFDWGVPDYFTTSFNNQFSFDGLSFTNIEDNTAFAIGNFSYRNGSTYNSTGISGVDLDVNLTIVDPLSIANDYNFSFSINQTPNTTGDPVADGDIVNATSGYSTTTFSFDGALYTLNLLGFSSDGGATIRTDFSSPEGATQNAQLFARITSEIPNNVPEPGILSMFVVGLITLGGFSFARKK
jgi:hypothetical protein